MSSDSPQMNESELLTQVDMLTQHLNQISEKLETLRVDITRVIENVHWLLHRVDRLGNPPVCTRVKSFLDEDPLPIPRSAEEVLVQQRKPPLAQSMCETQRIHHTSQIDPEDYM